MILTSTNEIIKAYVAETASIQPSFFISYADNTSTQLIPGKQIGTLNNTTEVTVVNAPTTGRQRIINAMDFCNNDSIVHNFIVISEIGVTKRFLANRFAVSGKKTLHWSKENGFFIRPESVGGGGTYNDALISARITSVNENVVSAYIRFAAVSTRLTSVKTVTSARITSVNSRIATVSGKHTSIKTIVSARITSVNENITSALTKIATTSARITSVNTKVNNVSTRITSVNENVTSIFNGHFILKTMSVQTGTFTIQNERRYPVDTSATAISVNMPAPTTNFIFGVFDAKGTWTTNNLKLRSTTNNLVGTSILECDLNNYGIILSFTSATGWRFVT